MSSKVRNVAFSTWPLPCSGAWSAAFCAHAVVVKTKGTSSPAAVPLSKKPSGLLLLCLLILSAKIFFVELVFMPGIVGKRDRSCQPYFIYVFLIFFS